MNPSPKPRLDLFRLLAICAFASPSLASGKSSDPSKFNWIDKKSTYAIHESSAGKSGVIFVTHGGSKEKVVVKLFSPGETDPLLPQVLQHELLDEAAIPADSRIAVYRKADSKTKKKFGEIEKKLKELLPASSKQVERISNGIAEIRVTPYLNAYALGLSCDSIAGIHNLPTREIKDANGKTVLDPHFRRQAQPMDGKTLASDQTLHLNEQLGYLNAYLKMLSTAGKSGDQLERLGRICAIDALVGNEDRALKEGVNNWGNVMLIAAGTGSKRKMEIAAIDNGGTCIGRDAFASDSVRIMKAPGRPAPEKKWETAVWRGYLDQDSGFASVNLQATVESAASDITEELKAELTKVLDGFHMLHKDHKLLAKTGTRASDYGAGKSTWTLRPAVRVDPIAEGTKDKKKGTAPRDSGEFVYEKKEIVLLWDEIEKSIRDGIRQGVAELSSLAGGEKMIEATEFGNSELGKSIAAIQKDHGKAAANGDQLDSEILQLRAYYLHQRVVKDRSHDEALADLSAAIESLSTDS